MRSFLLTLTTFTVSTICAFAQTGLYVAQVSGHQQVPSVASQAESQVIIELSGDTIFIDAGAALALTSPIDQTIGAHIHTGYIGQNGPVVLPLPARNNATNAIIVDTFLVLPTGTTALLKAEMDLGRTYINVHTLLYPGGEVRGQLVPDAGRVTAAYDAMLYGDQENPGVTTDGMGGILMEVRADSMFFSGSFSMSSPLNPVGGTGAHIHTGFFGQNGPVVLPLTSTPDAGNLTGVFTRKNNGFALDTNLVNFIRSRNAYVNIHSIAHPSGEIRGQMVTFGTNIYLSHVSHIDPMPFPNPSAYLRVMTEKVPNSNRVQFSGSWSGWGNEIRARKLRPVITVSNPFVASSGTALGLLTIPAADSSSGIVRLAGTNNFTAAQQQGLFLRFGTSVQWRSGSGASTQVPYSSPMYHECKRAFYSSFTGAQEVPSTPSNAVGEIITEYYTNRIELNGTVEGLSAAVNESIAGGFHIHEGLAGRAGGIVAPVSFLYLTADSTGVAFLPDRNILNLTPEAAAVMLDRGLYYNIHTRNYASGEVRAQLLPRSNSMMHAILEPAQAMPGGGPTDAAGGLLVEADANRMIISGSFDELSGFNPAAAGGAHLHAGLPGVTGGIIYPLTTSAESGDSSADFLPETNTFPVSKAALDSLVGRQFYANIHSTTVPSGEIRGQVGPYATNMAHAKLTPDVTVPYTGDNGASKGIGHVHTEIYDTTLVLSGSFRNLSSAVDQSIAGGAHIHMGEVGNAGPIAFPISFVLSNNDTAAVIMPANNVRQLTFADLNSLIDNGAYANIHTNGAPSGAIRGQLLFSANHYPDAVEDLITPNDGATIDLRNQPTTTDVVVDWDEVDDEDDLQEVGYIWQLFRDTTMSPLVQSQVDQETGVGFTFGAIDTLLLNLGVNEAASASLFHRVLTTDGSLITPSDFFSLTVIRNMLVGVDELPAGSARLINNAGRAGNTMFLDINNLPAGRYTYEVITSAGQVSAAQMSIDHGGSAQRYELSNTPTTSGFYFLKLQDAEGRVSSWGFVIQ